MDHAGHGIGAGGDSGASMMTMPLVMNDSSATTMASTTDSMNNMHHGSGNHGSSASHPMVFTAGYSGFQVLFSFWIVDEPWQFFLTLVACFFIALFYELLRIYRHNHFIKDCKSRKRFMCFGAASLQTTPRQTVSVDSNGGRPVEVKMCCRTSEEAPPPVVGISGDKSAAGCCANNKNNNNNKSDQGNGSEQTTGLLGSSQQGNGNNHCIASSSSPSPRKRQHMHMLSKAHIFQTLMHVVLTAFGFLIMLAIMTFNAWLFIAVIAGVGVGYFVSGHLLESPVDANSCCL